MDKNTFYLNKLFFSLFYKNLWLISIFFIFICVFLQEDLFASTDEDLVEDSIVERESERLKKTPPEEKLSKPPQIELKEEKPTEVPPGVETTIKFFITKIKIEGCTVFSQEQLNKIISDYENKELNLIELNKVAEAITEMYRNAGFITSRAYIPPQRIKDGEVLIIISEAKLGEIYIEGNKYFRTSFIAKAFKDLQGKILNQPELERAFIYLNRNPDLEVKGILEAGKTPATTDIRLIVKDKFPHHAGYVFNNLGTRLTGYLRHIFSYNSNNFIGFGDSLSLQIPYAEEGMVVGGNINYIIPLNNKGMNLGITTSITKVKIGKEFKPSKIRGSYNSHSVYILKPLTQTNKTSTQIRIGLESIKSLTTIRGEKNTLNKLGVLKFGLITDSWDLGSRTNISNEFDFGFPEFLGASPKNNPFASPKDSSSAFSRYTFSIARLKTLTASSYLLLNCQGQVSLDKLPSPKRFSIGGAYSIRGYPEDYVSGDYGVSGAVELRTPFFIFPDNIIFKKKKLKNFLQFAFFTDIGGVFNRGEDKKPLLIAPGFGLRLSTKEHITARIDMAYPVTDKPTDKDNFKIHFSLNIQY